MEQQLLDQFDKLIERKNYVNRSEAIRDLIRNTLVEDQWTRTDEEMIGTVTLVYNHHTRDLADKLTEYQHKHHNFIISALHIHLDPHNCLEVIVVKGPAHEVRRMADTLIGTKGVKHGRLVTTTTGRSLV